MENRERAPTPRKKTHKEPDNILERTARAIVPPGQETADDELEDPGSATPDATKTDNRS